MTDWRKFDSSCGKIWSDSSRDCKAPLHWCMIKGPHKKCKCETCKLEKK